MSTPFRLRDCFRPLDYFLLGLFAGSFPIVFEIGIDVSPGAGIAASCIALIALLVAGFRAGREAERNDRLLALQRSREGEPS